MSNNIYRASREWATRPADERFTSLIGMRDFKRGVKLNSVTDLVTSRSFRAISPDDQVIELETYDGKTYGPTNWSFGQVARLAHVPSSYVRTLPGSLAADCINHGLHVVNEVEDVNLLRTHGDRNEVRAVTGPGYGRVWDDEVLDALIDRFGDGVTGNWRVPGEFGKAVVVDRDNTTLYASDRDMFVFLADEANRIEVADRRNGQGGSMARGIFAWNSEVGSKSLGAAFFYFDYVCENRIIWGAEDYLEMRVRHSIGAPSRWLDEVTPKLIAFSESSSKPMEDAISNARGVDISDKVDTFLTEKFGKPMVEVIKAAFLQDEERPIESLWDAVVGATAFARSITHQDDRVAVERTAGNLLKLAA